jgi:hypothetical protein
MELDSILEGSIHVNANNMQRSLEALITDPCNNKIATYRVQKEFYINNIGVLENENNVAFFEEDVRDGDIVGNFQSNVRIALSVGPRVFSSDNRIVLLNSQYTVTRVRLYVDPENLPEKVQLSYDASLLSVDLRSQVRRPLILLCDELKYCNGLVTTRN